MHRIGVLALATRPRRNIRDHLDLKSPRHKLLRQQQGHSLNTANTGMKSIRTEQDTRRSISRRHALILSQQNYPPAKRD
jgi:hypothetical protein